MIFQKNVPLKKHSNYKIGGPADYFFEFRSKEELIDAIKSWKEINRGDNKVFILGTGTNVLFRDDGFRGLVLKDSLAFIKQDGLIIEIGSGTLVSDLVSFSLQHSLSGFEWAGGLPGSVGGAIRGNAGAFGGEIKDNLHEVESINIDTFEIIKRNNFACGFGYRQSIFKKGAGEREIVLSAKFKFKKGNKEEIKENTQEKIDYRIDKHPLDLPNIGSTFKNIPVEKVPKNVLDQFREKIKNDPFPVVPVAKLLSEAGLKGKTVGGAQISTKHPNFIVNIGNAKAEDVKSLIAIAKSEIKNRYNISLEEEILLM